ncbi:MAG: HNH endonuclease, partial [Alphaproteobacteria bacterium]
MSIGTKICIYCGQNDPAFFKSVEHVVPQAFGTFGTSTPTLDCVCDTCNSHFAKNHDLYLA